MVTVICCGVVSVWDQWHCLLICTCMTVGHGLSNELHMHGTYFHWDREPKAKRQIFGRKARILELENHDARSSLLKPSLRTATCFCEPTSGNRALATLRFWSLMPRLIEEVAHSQRREHLGLCLCSNMPELGRTHLSSIHSVAVNLHTSVCTTGAAATLVQCVSSCWRNHKTFLDWDNISISVSPGEYLSLSDLQGGLSAEMMAYGQTRHHQWRVHWCAVTIVIWTFV